MDRKGELASMERRRAWLLILGPYQDQKSFRRKLNHSIDQADGCPMADWPLINVSKQKSLNLKRTQPLREQRGCVIYKGTIRAIVSGHPDTLSQMRHEIVLTRSGGDCSPRSCC